MNLDKIVVVLDHPEECRNIGAACRAMANCGISRLRIVGNKGDYDPEKIHVLAIHAASIYDNADFFESISDATKDCAIAAGTTRRRGKKRKGKLYLPEEFAESADLISGGKHTECMEDTGRAEMTKGKEIKDNGENGGQCGNGENDEGRGNGGNDNKDGENMTLRKNSESDNKGDGANVAVVFGNERTGLTDEQLSECTVGVTIPSSNGFASLNLSHAVQIMCYHLFRKKNEHIAGYTPLPLERIDKTVESIADNLQKIGFFSVTGRSDMVHFWRSLLSRSALSEGEAKYIERIFSKAAGLIGKKNKAFQNKEDEPFDKKR